MTRPLYSPHLLSDVAALPGAEHAFLKHLAGAGSEGLRGVVEEALERAPTDVQPVWRDALSSLENRRFFQAMSELLTVRHLGTTGWKLETRSDLALHMRDPGGRQVDLITMGFMRQVRPEPDRAVIHKMIRALGRLNARARIGVLIRRWLPHDFDPEPVRQAVDLWLSEVDRGGWQGRYAAFEDEHTSLEFCLTGRKNTGNQGVVAFTLGPFVAQHTVEVLETRLILELDRHRLALPPGQVPPVLLACVANQPWGISSSYLRSLLYGKPDATWTPDDGIQRMSFTPRPGPSLYMDPMYPHTLGCLMLSTDPDPTKLRSEAHLNPWVDGPVDPTQLPGPAWAADGAPNIVRRYP